MLLVRARLLVASAVVATLLAPVGGARAATGPPTAISAKAGWPTDAVAGSLLVTAVDERAAAGFDGPSFGRVAHITVPPGTEAAAAEELRDRPGVVDVEPDRWLDRVREPADPRYPEQWAHEVANAPAAWDTTTGDATVRVAVIDSGVDGRHRELQPNLVEQHQVTQDGARRVILGTLNDPCAEAHGTQVAGVLGAVADNDLQVAGVAWSVSIVDIAAVDTGRCQVSEAIVIAAMHHALTRDVRVVNLSVGKLADTCPTAWQAAVDAARSDGVVVVAAAGNDQGDFPGASLVPASCNGVISVGAVGRDARHATYSSANAHVDLAAPGGDPTRDDGVLTTDIGDRLAAVYGTSFATPYVAGVAALLLSIDPSLTPDQVEAHLERSATGTTRTRQLGWGVVDAGAAVASVSSGVAARQEPDPVFPVGLVVRVAEGAPPTDPIRQAAAISRRVFEPDRAQHVVIGRVDDYADALAGSSLGFGAGPLLFTPSTGPLAETTRNELERVLPAGGRVYLLGGTAALPPTLEGELSGLGYQARRLAGDTREGTAAAVAEEVGRRLPELGFAAPDRVILATARSWPDAVTAGSLGAFFGYPILLTPPGTLHPATRWALGRMRPNLVYVAGGTAAVSDDVMREAQRAAGDRPGRRLAGVDRSGTALQVALEFDTLFRSLAGVPPTLAVAVNLRRADGFTHVLSATAAIGAASGIFVPVEGEDGGTLPQAGRELACYADPFLAFVAGGTDVVSDPVQEEFNRLLEEGC